MARRRLSMDTPLIPLSPTVIEASPSLSFSRHVYETTPGTPQSPTWTDDDLQDSEKLVEGEPGGYRLLASSSTFGGSARGASSMLLAMPRRWWPFAIAAACAIVSAAIFYRETAQTVWSNVAMELGGERGESGLGCGTAEVIAARRDPGFWVTEVGSKYVTVRPRDRRRYVDCEDLANAFFSVRLHYASEIRLLEEPVQTSMGVYQFTILPPVTPQISPAASAEVILDMDFFPGGKAGMPCGQRECNYTYLMDSGMDWIGAQVFDQEGDVPTFKNSRSSLTREGDELPLCSSLDYLPGAWQPEISDYAFVDSTGSPCTILQAEPLPVGYPRKWIRFLGDSNSRKLLPVYAELLGANNSLSYKPEEEGHPTVLMAWNDELILTFSWWFMRQNVPADEEQDEEQLQHLLAYSLSDFLDSVPWDRTKPWPSHFEGFEGPADRIYLSIGSHAPQATTRGVRELLAKLEPLIKAVKSKVVINLTSATAPSRLPKLYIPTKVLRNNIMLKATNAAIAEWAKRLGLTVIDFFTITRTMGPEKMKDPVHFDEKLYTLWADMVYSEWVRRDAGDRR
ncbi:hypothetical protein BCR35DRAFT_304065 [Leucosporidium creatinivorum]|uniref:Uncharacterized protein n=1 Tax=Leucosporidium creatinivorum TaxID=106004 RepID=A0A1Y2FC70_9BASI|nr:hypothetical protein BCR35DRAFT_304065 [Leucosporidium creatinivorum]